MDAISKYGIIAIIAALRCQAVAYERRSAYVASNVYARSHPWHATACKVAVVVMAKVAVRRDDVRRLFVRCVLHKELSVRYVQQRNQKTKAKSKLKLKLNEKRIY